jgi:hypothetical protein
MRQHWKLLTETVEVVLWAVWEADWVPPEAADAAGGGRPSKSSMQRFVQQHQQRALREARQVSTFWLPACLRSRMLCLAAMLLSDACLCLQLIHACGGTSRGGYVAAAWPLLLLDSLPPLK